MTYDTFGNSKRYMLVELQCSYTGPTGGLVEITVFPEPTSEQQVAERLLALEYVDPEAVDADSDEFDDDAHEDLESQALAHAGEPNEPRRATGQCATAEHRSKKSGIDPAEILTALLIGGCLVIALVWWVPALSALAQSGPHARSRLPAAEGTSVPFVPPAKGRAAAEPADAGRR